MAVGVQRMIRVPFVLVHFDFTVIVNGAFASQAGLNTSIIGRRLIAPWRKEPYVIIGVVDNARIGGPAYADQSLASIEETLEAAVLARIANDTDPRFKRIMSSLIKHLHAFVREVAMAGVDATLGTIHRLVLRWVVTPQDYAKRAQLRLHRRFVRLVGHGKKSQVAITAVARELCGFAWGLMVA